MNPTRPNAKSTRQTPAFLPATVLASACAVMLASGSAPVTAQEHEEFRIKRESVFEFAAEPTVARDGDLTTIEFKTKANCDVTVVVEDETGRIVRHLASGVLGANAPPPFARDSLIQRILWDGKDDRGQYVEDVDRLRVRVSLGIAPQFDKVLLWEPKKRTHRDVPGLSAAPEGVYVYDGRVIDHVRLFDHDGNYARTIYPFPADKLSAVQGLHRHRFPQDGAELPILEGFHQSTLLTSGSNSGYDAKLGIGVDQHNNYHGAVWGNAATTLAVQGERIGLARLQLNRLATDGTTGGLPLTGPEVWLPIQPIGARRTVPPLKVSPRSSALSPDGRWLYLTGYAHGHRQAASRDIVLVQSYEWLPCVARLDYETGEKLTVFLGDANEEKHGAGPQQFSVPSSVAVDKLGRIYVSDYGNDRVQVFSPAGELLKSIPAKHPAQVSIHADTQEIYVFSWWLPHGNRSKDPGNVAPQLTILGSLDDPRPGRTVPLPIKEAPSRTSGVVHRAVVDGYAETTRVWLVTAWGYQDYISRNEAHDANIQIYALTDDGLAPVRDFNTDIRGSVARTDAPEYHRQRLYVDPVRGHLYVAEGKQASGKSFDTLLRIEPETGKVTEVTLPFDAEDMCFDSEGLIYLRTFYVVARYNPVDWREVPWDYGEEFPDVRTSSSRRTQDTPVASALRLPVKNAGLHHHGGMAVSPRGHLVVAVNNHGQLPKSRRDVYDVAEEAAGGKEYLPTQFPGRARWGEVHVWDKHGQLLFEDAVPGLTNLDGLEIDAHDNLYVLSATTRILGGKRYFNDLTETLLKVRPQAAKVVSNRDDLPLPARQNELPSRSADLFGGSVGRAWVQGAEWFYGGLGFAGKNANRSGGGCNCFNSRFALDYLGRSFAPEVGHFSVAVLDSAGNLITRIGRYGNADSRGPDSPVPLGGDEVGLFYAPYCAVQTDERLYIADPGNARIVAVKLGYHANRTLPLTSARRSPAASP